MQETNELLSLYSTLIYICIALAIVFFLATVFVFFKFRIARNIRQRFGSKKMTASASRKSSSSAQLARSQRVAQMEYQTTADLQKYKSGQLVKQPNCAKNTAEFSYGKTAYTEETTQLDQNNRHNFRIVKEETIIHTEEYV